MTLLRTLPPLPPLDELVEPPSCAAPLLEPPELPDPLLEPDDEEELPPPELDEDASSLE